MVFGRAKVLFDVVFIVLLGSPGEVYLAVHIRLKSHPNIRHPN